jgi:hypothetical protein
MLNASPDFASCYLDSGGYDPACADGFSEPLPLTVPKPKTRYSTSVTKYRFLESMDLRLVARPLGERRKYKLCYATKRVARKCLTGTLNGYDWNASARDTLSVRTPALKRTTTFTWLVDGRKVASKHVRVPS